jgi:hypothetical protein
MGGCVPDVTETTIRGEKDAMERVRATGKKK